MQNTTDRIADGLKKYRSIMTSARDADLNEDETVRRIIGILVDVLGYDRYDEILSQFEKLGKRCDLAVRLKGRRTSSSKVDLLIECKKVGLPLKDTYLKQAEEYAVLNGVKWAVLTNGLLWNVFSIAKNEGKEGRHARLIASADLADEATFAHAVDVFKAISHDGLDHDALEIIERKNDLFNCYVCAQLIMHRSTVGYLCDCFRSLGVQNVTPDDVLAMLHSDVFAPGLASDSKDGVKKARNLVKKLNANPPCIAAPPSPAPCAPSAPPSSSCADGASPSAPSASTPPSEPSDGDVPVAFRAKGIEARGVRHPDGSVTVPAGQRICPELVPSARGGTIDKLRRQLAADGVVAGDAFVRDYVFKSSSGAASLILGHGVNGNQYWQPAQP